MSYSRPTKKTPFVSHQVPDNLEPKEDITPTKPKYSRVTVRFGGAPHHLPVSHNVEKDLETPRNKE